MTLRDPVCSASHLLFAVWAGYASLVLLRLGTVSRGRQAAGAVFGLSMVLLYAASGLFHAIPFKVSQHPKEFRFLQLIDQSAIFILIAGTNTPMQVAFLRMRMKRFCLVLMWALAAIGAGCLWLLPKPPHEAIVSVCLAMGWLGFLPIVQYYRAVGWRAMNWVWAGAVLYTFGAVCELVEWPVLSLSTVRFGYHETFHILTASASLAFFLFIARHVIPYSVQPQPEV